MLSLIQRYGFAAIVVMASVPNPLFDLAGLTCGHFGIPFSTFFLATALGKGVIKTTLQSVFYTLFFRESTLLAVQAALPGLAATGVRKFVHLAAASISKSCRSPMVNKRAGDCDACCARLFKGVRASAGRGRRRGGGQRERGVGDPQATGPLGEPPLAHLGAHRHPRPPARVCAPRVRLSART